MFRVDEEPMLPNFFWGGKATAAALLIIELPLKKRLKVLKVLIVSRKIKTSASTAKGIVIKGFE